MKCMLELRTACSLFRVPRYCAMHALVENSLLFILAGVDPSVRTLFKS